MIISHKYKFIFIKTYKTAGTSLEVFLSGVCGEDDIITPIYPEEVGHRPRNYNGCYNHMPAIEVKEFVGKDVWKNYFKFCVERNPWEKFVSFYWMERSRRNDLLTIDEFMHEEKIGLNWPLYTDPITNKPMVDEVLKYESLNGELGRIFSRLNIPWSGSLSEKAKGEYRKDRSSYKNQLSKEQIKYLAARFKYEIEWFGYAE